MYLNMKTMYTHLEGTLRSGAKRGLKRVSSKTPRKEKKYEIGYFSQVAKVCLFKEFGSFPPTPNKQ